jgi:hypothetical protein
VPGVEVQEAGAREVEVQGAWAQAWEQAWAQAWEQAWEQA